MNQSNPLPEEPSYEEALATLETLARAVDPELGQAPSQDSLPEEKPQVEAETDLVHADASRVATHWKEQTLSNLLESFPDALVVVNSEGFICKVNLATEQMFGYTREELLGAPLEILIPQRFRQQHVGHRNHFFSEPRTRPMGAQLDLFGRRKDGRDFPVEISLSPVHTTEGLFATAAIRDISGRKRQEAKFRTLVENIPAVTFVAAMDENSSELYVSPQIEKLLGFTQKEWLEDPILWYRQLHPDDQFSWNAQFAPTCADGKPFRSVYRFISKDGRVVWIQGSANVVRDAEGKVLFLQGVAFDITSIKEAEEEREQFFSLSLDLLCVLESEGYFKRINQAFTQMLGYPAEKLLGKSFLAFVHPDDLHRTRAELEQLALGQPADFETRFRCLDGTYKWLQWSATPYLPRGLIYAIARDVTEQKRDEEALREQAKLALLRAEVSAALTGKDALPTMLQRCAIALTEHLGVAFARIWTLNEPENVLELQASAGIYMHLDGGHARVPVGQFKIGLIASQRTPLCTNTVQKDDRIHDQEWARREGMVSFAGYPLLISDHLVGVLALFGRQPLSETVFVTLELIAAQVSLGIEHKWSEEALYRAKAELEDRVEERTQALLQSNAGLQAKTLELEQFAYHASHDLNEPLRTVLLHTRRLEERTEEIARNLTQVQEGLAGLQSTENGLSDGQSRELCSQNLLGDLHWLARSSADLLQETVDRRLGRIKEGAANLGRLIQKLREYDHVNRRGEVKQVDSKVVVEAARANLQGAIEEHDVRIDCPPLPAVMGVHEHLVLLFQNLISNAIKYRHSDRTPRIEVGAEPREDHALFWVRDNGMGIEPKFLTRIFEMGWRAHSRSKIEGWGYGLNICLKTVTRHEGEIWAASEVGQGTTFYFTLPLSRESLAGKGEP